MPRRSQPRKDALDRLLDVTDHYCEMLGTSMPRMTAKYRRAEIRRLVRDLLRERADAAWKEADGLMGAHAVKDAVLSRPRKGAKP